MDTKHTCKLLMRSVTYAMKAESELASLAIRAKAVRAQGKFGCGYAIEFDCAQSDNVKAVLSRSGIPYGDAP